MASLLSLLKGWFARPAPEQAEAHDRFRALLELQRRHTLLAVRFPRTERSYQSMVLELRPEEGCLLIDELFPADGRDDLLEGDVVEVSGRSGAGPVSFLSRLLQREEIGGAPAWRLELPEEIGASYRRGAFRVYVEREQELQIELADGEGNPCSAYVVNLSIEGIKVSIAGDVQEMLRARHPHSALLRLPGGDEVDCTIDFSHIYLMRTPSIRTLAGGVLHVPSSAQRNRLGQWLAAVQRKQRRREARIN